MNSQYTRKRISQIVGILVLLLSQAVWVGAGGPPPSTWAAPDSPTSTGEKVAAASSGPVVNDVHTVTNTDDSGPGSLRQAIADASPGDTIDFALTYPATIVLTSGQLEINKDLTILGPGAESLTISGNAASRAFFVYVVNVSISDLTVSGGDSYAGSGIYNCGTLTVTNIVLSGNQASFGGGMANSYATLTVINSTFSGNQASYGGGISNNTGTLVVIGSLFSGNQAISNGGGIDHTYGTLTVTNCIFSDNQVGANGGGIRNGGGAVVIADSTFFGNQARNGGGIYNESDTIVTNSTFFDNWASYYGGGIYNQSDATVANSTFSDDRAANGGGIYNRSGTLNYRNTVIANSNSGGDCVIYGGTIGQNVNNLIEDGSCGAAFSGDPLLAPLADNGGETPTHALLPGSLAIDHGDNATCTEADQRGVERVGVCDIGAFESRGFTMTYGGGDGQSTTIYTPFANPLTLTVTSGYTEPVDGGIVHFVGPASGAGLNPITNTTTITGGIASVLLTANSVAGSYPVLASARGGSPDIIYNLTNTPGFPTYLPLLRRDG